MQKVVRESTEFDVVIVGAGVAGLSAAIRLKQLSPQLSVAVLEKAAEIGAHILSGAVVDICGIAALLPNWQADKTAPFTNPVQYESMQFLTQKKAWKLPHSFMPKILNNKGNYIVSLGVVCRWLAQKAENMGVDIFPGFAAAEGVFNDQGALIGIQTGDMGLKADNLPGTHFTPGMVLYSKYVLVAEGARGSLTQALIRRFGLDKNAQTQKYGLGLKELWEISPEQHRLGKIIHYVGWPLGKKASGGGFVYHMERNKIALGLVVHLDYVNPYFSPFEEFQQWKTHPALRTLLQGGKRHGFGARVINEGGFQSVPRLSFKGGALIGCAAGFVNLPRIKGSHNAVLSGIYAAEQIAAACRAGRAHDEPTEIETGWRKSAIGRDLYPVRNAKPLLERHKGIFGLALSSFDIWCNSLLKFSPFGTLCHKNSDAAALKPAAQCQEIHYPKPDNRVSFDRPSSLVLANISAREDAPCHLKVLNKALQKKSEWGVYHGPSVRYCPAGVYEWQKIAKRELPNLGQKGEIAASGKLKAASDKQKKKHTAEQTEWQYCIFAQNCVHCKTCDIKDPNNNIRWTVPEGGEGPLYSDM